MKLSQKDLYDILVQKAQNLLSQDEAEYFASESIETHLRKIPRNNPIKGSIGDLLGSIKSRDTKIQIENDLGASLRVNFHSHGPLVYSKMIHDLVEERSKKYGICMISLINSQGIHTLQHWVQGLAKRGILSIISANGGPEGVIPYNGTKGVFGTNPLAYGIPNKSGDQCIDMATSEAPYFEIMQAHAKGESLRTGIAVDGEGNPTTNTQEALDFSASELDPISNLVPMGGGYKGYNIVYLLEMMTSGLIGSPSSTEMSSDFIAQEHGAFLIAIHPGALGTQENLQNSLDSINSTLQKQKPKKGETIEVPGYRSNETLLQNQDIEIEIDDALFEKLNSIGN